MLRARKGTPHSKNVVTIEISSDEESDQDSDALTPTSGDEDVGPKETGEKTVPTEALGNLEIDATVPAIDKDTLHGGQPFEADEEEDNPDVTNFAFDEGTTRMPDDTTLMDSESFSMISVASLPSSGGLTSPPKPEDSKSTTNQGGLVLEERLLGPSTGNTPNAKSQTISKPSPAPSNVSPYLKATGEPSRPALQRYITPFTETATPSNPPVIEPVQTVPPKSETPRLGRVVTAGVALQGLLDPSRITPEPSQKMLDEKRDRLDDLFRGFSEGTRRELQAGLRLGEQLATGQTNEPSAPAHSSPIRSQPRTDPPREGVYKTQRKPRQPRLLTPEDQVEDIISSVIQPENSDVPYPLLPPAATERSLPSPERSGDEDEMSWRIDTPPVATGKMEHTHFDIIANEAQARSNNSEATATCEAGKSSQQEDYSDIWQEEASRSSNSAEVDDVSQPQDMFEPGPVVPSRGKLPRTWRRTNGNHFHYSDEAKSPQQPMHANSVSVVDINDDSDELGEEEGAGSDGSDDTGMFFQSNMPNVFSKRHSRDLKQKKADKLDLTLLMNEGESLAPESSPPAITKKPTSTTKSNPFVKTPPRFPAVPSSPQKRSPLRRELHSSDISSEVQSHFQDESSLPLVQSSPFHTFVGGETIISVASDQRQLQMEMEGVTDSSIRHLRDEADDYLEAYEPQERSLDWIEEVTEPSRTWHKNTSMVASSPPQMKILSPVRRRVSLFQNTPDKIDAPPPMVLKPTMRNEPKEHEMSEGISSYNQQRNVTITIPTEQPPQRSSGLLTRMTSTLWSAVSKSAATSTPEATGPVPHPILTKLTPLPKIEPWTKTHYKTLDRLFNINQKHTALFSPSVTPATPLSQTNAHLLSKFLTNNNQPYVGAVFSAWGYEFDMTEELVVLCQVFCELMSLDSIEAYQTLKGREIEMGDCLPGRTGEAIEAEEVVRRLATVILGEEVRADERRGATIDRRKGLEVHWPQ
ncbi:hypothetical protein GQ44DRAFT_700131 [Phaeosphaeriaceae sp. PMI808]|nr:hypothetical protein GQ44DRAFT_700131 [Phaeosphaeriaceae sp. PMI808]